MKLPPMEHQAKGFELMTGRDAYGLFCEQGTGKTYMLLWDAERCWVEGEIEGMLVIAPNGVQRNWIRREIPKLVDLPWVGAVYESTTKRFIDRMEEMQYMQGRLKILAMNVESIRTKKGMAAAIQFCKRYPTYMVVDESQRIKSPKSAQAKAALALGRLCPVRRIATGTPATNSPADVFSQFEFLQSGLLGTTSYRAFVAQYCELLPPGHPTVAGIHEQWCNRRGIYDEERMRDIPGPQILARDDNGSPIFRNLDELNRLMEPHSFRVLKKDCLDLPPKIYRIMDFDLTPAQRRAYEELKDNLRIELEDGHIETVKKLALGQKLQQITSGFILVDGEPERFIGGDNPRLDLFKELATDMNGKFLVWCRFRAEIEMLTAALNDMGIAAAAYYGGTKKSARDSIIDSFQEGSLRVIVGHPMSGGVGLTLTAAESVIYYSNDFSLENRLQSEDRAHRKGLNHKVLYIDIVAANTIDERILAALQTKSDMAAAIVDELR